MHDLGIFLESLRDRRGLSRPELARMLGFGRGTVWAWESGERTPGVDDLIAYLDAVGATDDDWLKVRSLGVLPRDLTRSGTEPEQLAAACK